MQRIPPENPLQIKELRLHGLFVRGLEGDSAAYRGFLQDSAAHLRAFLRRRLQRWPDAVEDLVQESLLAIHNQRHTYDPQAPLTSWMHAIARYKLIDWMRRHGRREALDTRLDDADDLIADSDADNDAVTAGRDLAVLLATLPDKQRLAIVATRLDGLSVREAADQLGLSESDIKISVHRGLKTLALNMQEQR